MVIAAEVHLWDRLVGVVLSREKKTGALEFVPSQERQLDMESTHGRHPGGHFRRWTTR